MHSQGGPERSVKTWHDSITLSKLHHQKQTANFFLLTIIYQMHHKPTKKEIMKKNQDSSATNSHDDGMDVQKVEIYFKPQ